MFKKQILVTLLLACFLLWTNSGYSQTKPDRKSLLVERTDSQKWALLIGVDDYSNINDLEFCGADQRALYSQLINNGFKKENIFLLHDGAKDNKYLPFKNNIEKQLKTILKIVEHEDVLLVAFSGHGVNLDGNTYFCPTDADLERVTTLIPIQFIYEQLRSCKATLKLLMIDACRNDPRPRGARTPDNPTRNFAKSLKAAKPPLGVIVFSSCTLGEISHENESLKHGVFMHYVLEGIDGKADRNRNGKVSLGELTGYAGRNTKLFVARKYNDVQRPFINGELTTEVLDYDLFTVSKSSELIVPLRELEIKKLQAAWATRLKTEVTVTNSIGMKFTLIPPGEFKMGSPVSEEKRSKDEFQHQVKITQPFFMATKEVTKGQWEQVMGTQPWAGR
ncbi:MAG: caspase family protein, partial [Planctomycetaceae bacterium]|nr:caspase family protein [Planctomycetaceae bacterium]